MRDVTTRSMDTPGDVGRVGGAFRARMRARALEQNLAVIRFTAGVRIPLPLAVGDRQARF